MSSFNRLVVRIARAETPLFRLLKKTIKAVLYPTALVLPRMVLAPLRLVYELHYGVIWLFRSIATILYYSPLFQARCSTFGREVTIDGMVFVLGPVQIHIGDKVKVAAKISILSGNVFDAPQFVMKDRSAIGWGTKITVNKEVVLEEDVIVASGCQISDTDGHPREADLRAQGKPPFPEDIRPVRICRNAWVGAGAFIMKGVTIGEGSIVAANSVVLSSVPPYCLAVGNPAEVLFRNYGRPSTERKPRPARKPAPAEQPVAEAQPAEEQQTTEPPPSKASL